MNTRAFLSLVCLLGVAGADAAQATSTTTSDSQATPQRATVAADESPLTTGTVSPVRSREKKLEDCMAIWEPATHMTKAQWRRTCNRQLDEEPRP